MKKKGRFLVEISIGLAISLAIAWGLYSRSTVIETASLKTYDFLTKLREPAPKSNVIKIVEIDEESLDSLGRWPWPRSITAALLDEIVDYGAKVVGANIFFTEEDQSEGMEEVTRLYETFNAILSEARPQLRRRRAPLDPFEDFLIDLDETRLTLDGDAILMRSIDEAGNIVLPMYFHPGELKGENPIPLSEHFTKESMTAKSDASVFPPGMAAIVPLDSFGGAALAIGHSNLDHDQDGTVRRLPPIMRYGNENYPSFALQLIREYKSLPRDALMLENPSQLSLRSFKLPIDSEGKTYLEFAGPAGTFDRFSALDILSRAVPEKELLNKIVLVGVTAPGQGQVVVVPSGENFTGLELIATQIDNILSQRFISRPPWVPQAEWGIVALAALFVIFGLPFIRGKIAIPLAFVLFVSIIGGSFFLFVKQGVWLTPVYGASLIVLGFMVSLARKLLFTERGKEMVEAEGMETNKMLGLSFQGQGMLDLAFEKFRKCPIDAGMKDVLYNLALDMERKRQFSKAAAVYEHIATDDPKYKDIQSKIELLKKAGQGAVFGGVGKKGSDATVVVEGLGQSTTLGRYEVQRELGRGAMGIVYLGKDPKINRQVAIKTLRFEDEVDEDQAKNIKERFFREAESAGNLTHPNIIRIFDAGEDQDVAYIAMELIEGEDLKRCCEKTQLLPIPKVIDYMAQVAEALGYAHKQGVVHRDIKPGNIMLLKDGTLRITDFGIARIQATSKTATGAVLGTPAYMSPEQVNGQKVDGRADIFSLGVTLFEMITGEKPFVADSIAALLYRIANVDHPDPREFNPKCPECVIPILKKALAKDAANRYQSASEMANDLKECLKSIGGGSAAPAGTKAPAVKPAAAVPPPAQEPAAPQKEPEKPAPPAPPEPPAQASRQQPKAPDPIDLKKDLAAEAAFKQVQDETMAAESAQAAESLKAEPAPQAQEAAPAPEPQAAAAEPSPEPQAASEPETKPSEDASKSSLEESDFLSELKDVVQPTTAQANPEQPPKAQNPEDKTALLNLDENWADDFFGNGSNEDQDKTVALDPPPKPAEGSSEEPPKS